MAENPEPVPDDHEEEQSNYKAPAQVSVDALLKQDAEDESLRRYKEQLLGGANAVGVVVKPDNPKLVLVEKLALLVDGRPEMEMDLTGSLTDLKKKPMILKEGVSYKVRIYFYVQREIVSGLRYNQNSYRAGIRVDKTNFMVGSYGPKLELQSYTTPPEEAPSGMMARGTYTIKSLFTDDDKNELLKWEWQLEIKKEWP